MPRARDPNRDRAFAIYEGHNGDIDLVKIADMLKVSPGTVRGWKSKDRWEDRVNGAPRKNTERSKKKNREKEEAAREEVKLVMGNPELTDKQRLFCCIYVRCFNATKAYQKAYGAGLGTAMAAGSRLLRNAKVRDEIQRLKQARLNREMLDESDIFQKYMDIAFADMTDYVEFGRENIPVIGPAGPVEIKDRETGDIRQMTREANVVRFRESDEVDGTLISEVKQGRDGASIKLADRLKALDWISAHMDCATEEQKARIAQIRANTAKIQSGSASEGLELVRGWVEKVVELRGRRDGR